MQGKPDSRQPRRGPRLLVALTERELRKRGALADDDRIIELKPGKIERWSVSGSKRPIPPLFSKLDIARLRGMVGCGYSSQRLFFGSNGNFYAGLESVWHADGDGTVLRLAFSAPLVVVRWRSPEAEDAADVAGFAGRILAQRERRLAELAPEARQTAADMLADLQWRGLLAVGLAELEGPSQPRTYVGRLLRANFLSQQELQQELAAKLNGGKPGWNHDEPAVVESACQIAVRRLLGSQYDDSDITKIVDVLHAATHGGAPVDRRKAEAIIREALGEPNIDVTDIDSRQKLRLRLLVATYATSALELGEPAVDWIITESERIAFDHGWTPPVAPDS